MVAWGQFLFSIILLQEVFYFAALRIFLERVAIKGEETSPFAAAYPFRLLVCVRVPLLTLFACSFVFVCLSLCPPCLLAAFRLLFACFFCAKKRRKKSKFSCFCATFSPSYKKNPFWVKKLKKIAKKSHIFPVISWNFFANMVKFMRQIITLLYKAYCARKKLLIHM